MKLLRCNIVNYGCLHNFSYEFQPGMNLICQPNGWGKSTFASFLCAMLYGLDSTTKRSIQENERKHYHPWQEGLFGGSLEFEISGRQYRAERFFGLREREDTFALYDLKTRQPSQDYSSRLGIELFGIDKAGYLHSTFVPQGHSAPAYNDTLAARLTRLSQSPDDISQYEKAISKIDNALRFYVKTGKRGEIAILQQKSASTQQQLQESLFACEQLTGLNSQRNNLEQQKDMLSEQLQSIQQQIHFFTEQEIYAHYNLLQSNSDQKEHALEEIEEFFHDQLPDDKDIELYLRSCSRLSQLEQQKQSRSFSRLQMQEYTFLQTFFTSGNVPSDAVPETLEESLRDTPENSDDEFIFTRTQQRCLLESDFYKTEASFLFSEESKKEEQPLVSEHLPEQETIEQARKLYYQYRDCLSAQKQAYELADSMAQQIQNLELSLKQEQKQEQRQKQGPQEHKTFSPLYVPIVLFVIGLLTCCLWTPAIGLTIILSGSVLAVYLLFLQKKNTDVSSESEQQIHHEMCIHLQKQITQMQEQLDLRRNQFTVSRNEANDLQKQLLIISEKLNLPHQASEAFTDTYLTALAQLEHQLQEYQQNREKQYHLYKKQLAFYNQLKHTYENYNLTFENQKYQEQQIADQKQDIIQFMQPYFSIPESPTISFLEIKLHELRTKLHTYRNLLSDMRIASQNLNSFFQEHPDFQKVKQPDNQLIHETISTESLAALQSEESILREQYASCIQQLGQLQSRLEQLQKQAEKRCILEEEFLKLEQQVKNDTERYHILSLTKQYLTKARHDFTNNYLHSIEKNFNHYAQLLERSELLNANMNTDFHMLISDNGVLRDAQWYSRGTQDLIELCSRLAIIEDLFTEEAPFLVLDDPFVNLDNTSLQKLSLILKNISKKWQILYFTCHSSRNILT